jgi:phosphoribosylglycinamide formyltransferase-1
LIQKQVRVSAGDTPETLQKKVLKVEHKIYWEAIKLIEQNKVKFAGRKVVVEN